MSGNVVQRLFGRITPERMRVALVTARTMWVCAAAVRTAPSAARIANRTPKTPSALTALNVRTKKFMGARNDRNYAADVGVLLGGCKYRL